ncbi:MAG: hypothetical protein VXZ72_01145, partial [Chlamydiota bacterium]|nr:hypothetical protein [Chlamydiota bacterium]
MLNEKVLFAKELSERDIKKQPLARIGAWAFNVYIKYKNRKDVEFLDLLVKVQTVQAGPEFAMTYEELIEIGNGLIDDYL